jgi:hypothetical protein
MSTFQELNPSRNFDMRIDVAKGPTLVVRFEDGWDYSMPLDREQALYLASLLLTAAVDES